MDNMAQLQLDRVYISLCGFLSIIRFKKSPWILVTHTMEFPIWSPREYNRVIEESDPIVSFQDGYCRLRAFYDLALGKW